MKNVANRKRSVVLAFCLAVLLGACALPTQTPQTISPVTTAEQVPDAVQTPVPTTDVTASATPSLAPPSISAANARDLEEQARWGQGWVLEVIYSPDGRQVALVTPLGVYLYDAETLSLKRFLETESDQYAVAFSPDWTTLAWAAGNEIRLLDLSDGSLLRTLKGQPGTERMLTFSSDGSLLASILFPPGEEVYTGYVELWRVSDGTLVNTWDSAGDHVAFSPDGETVASWQTMTGIRLWQVADGILLHTIEDWIDDVAFSPDGETLAAASMNVVRRWRVADWSPMPAMESSALETTIRAVFSPDGTMLASVSRTGMIQLWQVADSKPLAAFGPDSGTCYGALAFAPDGKTLASAAMDVQFWQVPDGAPLRALEGHLPPVQSANISPHAATIAAVTEGMSAGASNVLQWQVSDSSTGALAVGGEALSLAYSPDGTSLALGMWDSTVWLVRASDGQVVHTMQGHTAQVQSVAFAPDGELLASSSMGDVRVWQVRVGTLVRAFEPPGAGWVESATFSPDGSLLAAFSNGKVWVWQVADGTLVRTFETEDDGYSGRVAFSPDGAALALGKHNQVHTWKVSDGALLRRLDVPGGLSSMAFSADGSLVAIGSAGTVELWRVSDGSLVHSLKGHIGAVTSVDFSVDGQVLLSGSRDGTVRLWGLGDQVP